MRKSPGPHVEQIGGLLPMVIGVTGHRDLRAEDISMLEQKVAEVFYTLREDYPATPLIVLSALAEGADQLVARVGLRHGAHLIAPLPLPEHVYREDFESEERRMEFEALLQSADCSFAVTQLSDEPVVRREQEARDRQYAEVGAYIVRHSQLLIALWDGRDAHLMGGTAQVISYQLHGIPVSSQTGYFDEVETGPVVHIVTPRKRNPRVADPFQELTLVVHHPSRLPAQDHGQTAETASTTIHTHKLLSLGVDFERISRRLNDYNADALRLGSRLKQQREQSEDRLVPRDSVPLTPALLRRLDEYATADTMAEQFKSRMRRLWCGLFVMLFAATAFFELFHLWESRESQQSFARLFIGGYTIALIAPIFFWYTWAKRSRLQSKYLDCRALAEGLRVHVFWRLAGLSDSVADHYLLKQKSELDWIRSSLRVADLPRSPEEVAGATAQPALMDVVQRYWVDSQCRYFRRVAPRDERSARNQGHRTGMLFGIGALVGITLTVIFFLQDSWIHDNYWLNIVLILGSTLFPLIAGLLNSFSEKMSYREQAKQYHQMARIFTLASVKLAALQEHREHDEAQGLIRALGEEALRENADWVLLHRARPMELLKGS